MYLISASYSHNNERHIHLYATKGYFLCCLWRVCYYLWSISLPCLLLTTLVFSYSFNSVGPQDWWDHWSKIQDWRMNQLWSRLISGGALGSFPALNFSFRKFFLLYLAGSDGEKHSIITLPLQLEVAAVACSSWFCAVRTGACHSLTAGCMFFFSLIFCGETL